MEFDWDKCTPSLPLRAPGACLHVTVILLLTVAASSVVSIEPYPTGS